MSYDIELKEPVGDKTIEFENAHRIEGGTYAVGGTTEAWLNITYNYGKHYRRVFGEKGIRTIYGMTGAESIPIIKAAMAQLGDDVSSDYWESTEGNAKKHLRGYWLLHRCDRTEYGGAIKYGRRKRMHPGT